MFFPYFFFGHHTPLTIFSNPLTHEFLQTGSFFLVCDSSVCIYKSENPLTSHNSLSAKSMKIKYREAMKYIFRRSRAYRSEK